MVTTRTGSGSVRGQGNENADYQEDPVQQPPPPPAEGPDWRQLMANQNQLINLLAQSIHSMQNVADNSAGCTTTTTSIYTEIDHGGFHAHAPTSILQQLRADGCR